MTKCKHCNGEIKKVLDLKRWAVVGNGVDNREIWVHNDYRIDADHKPKPKSFWGL
jgi:hypothetical protein